MARDLDPSDLAGEARLRRIDRLMELVGVILLPVGLTAILLGYLGASREGLVFLQVPYLISGGLLGVGLLFASGSVYLASWISRSAAATRAQNAELIEEVRKLSDRMATMALAAAGEGARTGNGTYVATPSGSMFHRPDCAVVTGRDDLREVSPEGMNPCGMCDPLAADGQAAVYN
jgi:hypothetical protein